MVDLVSAAVYVLSGLYRAWVVMWTSEEGTLFFAGVLAGVVLGVVLMVAREGASRRAYRGGGRLVRFSRTGGLPPGTSQVYSYAQTGVAPRKVVPKVSVEPTKQAKKKGGARSAVRRLIDILVPPPKPKKSAEPKASPKKGSGVRYIRERDII